MRRHVRLDVHVGVHVIIYNKCKHIVNLHNSVILKQKVTTNMTSRLLYFRKYIFFLNKSICKENVGLSWWTINTNTKSSGRISWCYRSWAGCTTRCSRTLLCMNPDNLLWWFLQLDLSLGWSTSKWNVWSTLKRPTRSAFMSLLFVAASGSKLLQDV